MSMGAMAPIMSEARAKINKSGTPNRQKIAKGPHNKRIKTPNAAI